MNYFNIIIPICVISFISYNVEGSSYDIYHLLNYELINKETIHRIAKRQATGCEDFQYRCTSGDCIDESAVCDGVKDCRDGSDENAGACGNVLCPGYNFRCTYGACISSNLKCNGRADCADNSDENEYHCPSVITKPNITHHCKYDEFKCKSGNCISSELLCNTILDCEDGSDETRVQCENTECPSFNFQCDYGACIDKTGFCNGKKECPDGSDESSKHCKQPSVTQKPTIKPPTPTKQTPSKPTATPPTTSPNSCSVPSAREVNFKVTDNKDNTLNIRHGSKAPQYSKIIVMCNKGYAFEEKKATFESVCYNEGKWIPELPPCIKTCKALYAPNMEFTCRRKGQEVNCDGEQLADTSLRPQCAPLFSARPEPYFTSLTCQEDGSWDQSLFSCVADCGLQSHRPQISGGGEEMYGDSPWHVAIYLIRNDIVLICGGTLIHPKIVVSAAHCFYDESIPGPRNNTKDYEIFVSKIKRDYTSKDKSSQQKYKIKQLIFSERGYNPIRADHHGTDIILIVLEKQVVLSQYVLPACLSYTDNHGFNPGENVPGKLSGWGLDSTGKPSEILLTAEIPFMSYNKCLTKETHVTPDKFCAGGDTGPGAQSGDSGGGLLFRNPQNGLYYLRGIVSTKGRYSNTSISTFTDISWYIDWIVKVRNRVDTEIMRSQSTLGHKT